jgi:aryl-alcohol dehydrogenase-like predicted oxidoreductase
MNLKPTFKSDIYKSDFPFYGSRLVFGTSGLGGVWGKVEEQESIECILYALENGITSFDTAPSYGNAEMYLGKALKQWKGEQPFISTKIGRLKADTAFDAKLDYSPKAMKESLQRSLELLGVSKVNLLFLHEPQWVPLKRMEEILEILISLKEDGYTDLLGIGGNPSPAFMPFINHKYFQVTSSFCKMDACNLSAFNELLPVTLKENIAVYAASALHFSLLGNRFHQFVEQHPGYAEISDADIKNAWKVNAVAVKNNMPLSALSQRYLFSIEEATRVVIGARKIEQIKSTVEDWSAGALPEALFNEITEIILTSEKQ